jgi:holliday junction DNA helicase RuvB
MKGARELLTPEEQDEDTWLIPNIEGITKDLTANRSVDLGKVCLGTRALRPDSFSNYIGQVQLKSNLEIAVAAAKIREESLDHILLHGPPGLGKTSMAYLIATELNVGLKVSSGPAIEKPGDLAAILSSLEARDVLFIDEIHRLPRVVEEVLYSAMEDYRIDIIIGQGIGAKAVQVPLNQFTLVGATTRSGMLTSPLRDRFGIALRMAYYELDELQLIINRSANILNVTLDSSAAAEIARRSRGTPRIANRLLKRVRDYASVYHPDSTISQLITNTALSTLDIDESGLDPMDRLILKTIIDKFNGGPVGIETIAASIAEDRLTVEDVYEPYLIQRGYLARTRRGREVTELGYTHLGIVNNKKMPTLPFGGEWE